MTWVTAAVRSRQPGDLLVGSGGRSSQCVNVAEVLRSATVLARSLRTWTRPGGVVGLLTSLPLATLVACVAAEHAGVSILHLNPEMPSLELDRVIATVRPSVVIASDGLEVYGQHEEAWQQLDSGAVAFWGARTRSRTSPDGTGMPPASHIFLTSGSVGSPRGVVRTAEAVRRDTERVVSRLGESLATNVILAAPCYHLYGFTYGVVGPLIGGGCVWAVSKPATPGRLQRAVRAADARTLIGSPAIFRALAHADAAVDLSRIVCAVSAGAPLWPRVIRSLTAAYSFDLLNCYGSSETGAVTLSSIRSEAPPAVAELGVALPGVRLRVGRQDAQSGGMLYVATDSLASSYLTEVGEQRLVTRHGWYATGDVATVSSGGTIELRGRFDNVINVAGLKVHPAEIERVISEHPDVMDVHVFASEDLRGAYPVAEVVGRRGVVSKEVTRWCRMRLAPYKVPRIVKIVDQLRISPMGKPLSNRGA